jgi:hypothetical protein
MTREQAETIALQALSFLVKDDELLEQFLTSTGLTLQELKTRVKEPELLGGVLDAILINDQVLLAFCNASALSPNTIIMARHSLPGGYLVE